MARKNATHASFSLFTVFPPVLLNMFHITFKDRASSETTAAAAFLGANGCLWLRSCFLGGGLPGQSVCQAGAATAFRCMRFPRRRFDHRAFATAAATAASRAMAGALAGATGAIRDVTIHQILA